MSKKIKWGIIGLGNIAHSFAEGLEFVENAMLTGVASSNKERAKEFAQKHSAKFAFAGYEQLASSQEVDVVYIASYTSLHYEHALLCLENGKHVLCEKPLTMSVKESEELFKLARSKNLFFMEALWTRFMPSIYFLEELTRKAVYGKIKMVDISFGMKIENNPKGRLLNPKLGGGALYDIGIYPIFLSQLLLGTPDNSVANVEFGETGVDIACRIENKHSDAIALLTCSFKEELPNEARIHYENAEVVLKSMWHCPTDMEITVNGKLEKVPLEWKGNGYNYEAELVTDTLLKGEVIQHVMPDSFTLALIKQIENALNG